MKKSRLILLISICSVLTLLISSYCVLRFGFGRDILDRSGWQEKDGHTRYLSYMGIPQKQWQSIDETIYYFDPDTGYLHTGWLTLEGSTYYIGSDGLCTGLQQIDGSTYFFDRNGHMNNTRYLDWVDDLLSSGFHAENSPKEFVICYFNEALEDQEIALNWALTEDTCLHVDAHRVSDEKSGVFSATVQF